MKKKLITLAAFSAIFLAYRASSFASTFDLTNGGLGQIATNPQQFNVSVCNNSLQPLTVAVPVNVSVGSDSATIPSASSIVPGQCESSDIAYSQLDMQAGQTYSVSVAIDPQNTMTSNTDDQATYSITVPAQPVSDADTGNLTAIASNNFPNPLSVVWNWFVGLLKVL